MRYYYILQTNHPRLLPPQTCSFLCPLSILWALLALSSSTDSGQMIEYRRAVTLMWAKSKHRLQLSSIKEVGERLCISPFFFFLPAWVFAARKSHSNISATLCITVLINASCKQGLWYQNKLVMRTICCQETVIPQNPPNVCVLKSHQLQIVYRKSVYVFWWNPRSNIFWHFPQKMKMRESSFQVFSILFFQSVLPQSMPCEPAIILLVKTLFLFIHVMMSGFCSLCHFAFLTPFHADAPLQTQAPKWGLMPLFSPCQPP